MLGTKQISRPLQIRTIPSLAGKLPAPSCGRTQNQPQNLGTGVASTPAGRFRGIISPATRAAQTQVSDGINHSRLAINQASVIARREGDSGLEMQTLAAAAFVSSNHIQYDECLEESPKAIELAGRVQIPTPEVAGPVSADRRVLEERDRASSCGRLDRCPCLWRPRAGYFRPALIAVG